MTLGAGGPRSYHGARFPGIPGLSGLSPQSHGALKVDRQNGHQHVSPPIRCGFSAQRVSQVVVKRATSLRRSEEDMQANACIRILLSCREIAYTFVTLCARLLPSFFLVCTYFVLPIKSNSLIITTCHNTLQSFQSNVFRCQGVEKEISPTCYNDITKKKKTTKVSSFNVLN